MSPWQSTMHDKCLIYHWSRVTKCLNICLYTKKSCTYMGKDRFIHLGGEKKLFKDFPKRHMTFKYLGQNHHNLTFCLIFQIWSPLIFCPLSSRKTLSHLHQIYTWSRPGEWGACTSPVLMPPWPFPPLSCWWTVNSFPKIFLLSWHWRSTAAPPRWASWRSDYM